MGLVGSQLISSLPRCPREGVNDFENGFETTSLGRLSVDRVTIAPFERKNVLHSIVPLPYPKAADVAIAGLRETDGRAPRAYHKEKEKKKRKKGPPSLKGLKRKRSIRI